MGKFKANNWWKIKKRIERLAASNNGPEANQQPDHIQRNANRVSIDVPSGRKSRISIINGKKTEYEPVGVDSANGKGQGGNQHSEGPLGDEQHTQ